MASKDKDKIKQKSEVIHWFRCSRLDYGDKYTGE